MIVVKVEMYPHGDKAKAYPLAVVSIANDGKGTKAKGNYTYALSFAGKNCGRRGVQAHGKVKGIRRNKKNAVYQVLYEVLRDAGVVS